MELVLENSRPAIPTNGHYDITDADVAALRAELDGYYQELKALKLLEPDEIFMLLSGFSARASEIRTVLVRRETRRATALRTKEVDPFLDECERQFRMWSRIQAVREMDFKLSGKTI